MPEGWALGVAVLLVALALQLVLLVVQHRVRDALRRRRGRPSLAAERAAAAARAAAAEGAAATEGATAADRTDDPGLTPLGRRLPGARISPPGQGR